MKIILLLLISFLIFSCSSSQTTNDRAEVKKTFILMNEYLKKGNYEAVYDMSYPNSFGNYTKAEVLNDLESATHNEGYDMRLLNTRIDSISKIYLLGSKKYARVDYTACAALKFNLLPSEDSSNMGKRFDRFCTNGQRMKDSGYDSCNFKKWTLYMKQQAYVFMIYKKTEQKWFVLSAANVDKIGNEMPNEIKAKLSY